MISTRELHKSFGPVHVLKGIDLDVEEGQVAVLIGPSGCGKSTLLRCLNLLEQPTSGALAVAGTRLVFDPATRLPERRQAEFRSKTGMVFQSFNLFPHMTVLENVASGHVSTVSSRACVRYSRSRSFVSRTAAAMADR